MKHNRITTLCSISCVAFLLTAVHAQSGSTAPVSSADKQFVTDALKGGMGEVELGKLASEKGTTDAVKQFGQKMVDDHTRLGDRMKNVAAQIGVTPPTLQSASDMALEAKLKLLSGEAFDKAYVNAMVKAHQEDLVAFSKEATFGTSPEVKEAASDGESTIRTHLNMIRKIAQSGNMAMQ